MISSSNTDLYVVLGTVMIHLTNITKNESPSIRPFIYPIDREKKNEINVRKLREAGSSLSRGNNPIAFRK